VLQMRSLELVARHSVKISRTSSQLRILLSESIASTTGLWFHGFVLAFLSRLRGLDMRDAEEVMVSHFGFLVFLISNFVIEF
jgi:hypothetical protein